MQYKNRNNTGYNNNTYKCLILEVWLLCAHDFRKIVLVMSPVALAAFQILNTYFLVLLCIYPFLSLTSELP